MYNDGPITAINGPGAANWNRQQTYTLTRVDYGARGWPNETSRVVLGQGLPVPPCNIGPLSTPNYAAASGPGGSDVGAQGYSGKAFCGQRADGFYVDLGAVFDLGDLRPFENAHNMFGLPATGLMSAMPGVNSLAASNVHTLALQIPIRQLTRNTSTPTSVSDPAAVIGIWTTASRQKVGILGGGKGHLWDRAFRPGVAPRQPAYKRTADRDRVRRISGTHSLPARTSSSLRRTATRCWPNCCLACTRAFSRT